MVHELFNEDSGILPPQLKGPYGLQQLLAMTADRMWRSQLRAIVTIAPLYGSYTIKCSENMQNTHIQKSQSSNFTPQLLLLTLVRHTRSVGWNPILISRFMSRALQTVTRFNTGMDCHEAQATNITIIYPCYESNGDIT